MQNDAPGHAHVIIETRLDHAGFCRVKLPDPTLSESPP